MNDEVPEWRDPEPAPPPLPPLPPPVASRDESAPAFLGSTVEAREIPLTFHGRGGELAALCLRNLVLSVLTLGLYAPWGRTAIRRYVWGAIAVGDTRLRYHGNPRELLFGHVLWTFVLGGLALGAELIGEGAAAIALLGLYVLWIFSVFGSRAYLFSRTSWRGIRFGLEGSRVAWFFRVLGSWVVVCLTCGLATSWRLQSLGKRMVGSVRYGDAKVTQGHSLASGSPTWALFGDLVLCGLTWGFYWWAAKANFFNRLVRDARIDNLQLESQLRGRDLFRAQFQLYLGTILTCGLAYPWLKCNELRILTDKLRVVSTGAGLARATETKASRGAFADVVADGMDFGL